MREKQTSEDQTAKEQEPPFSSLSPVKDVSAYTKYQGAFDFIVSDPLQNIALTGPYGSGKSSLIRTFREKHPKKRFLNLSLANFEAPGGKNPDEHEIEKSIFKQMLYGENANRLPYSRFKGIMTPEKPWRKAFYITILALGTYLLFLFKGELQDLAEENWNYFWGVISLLIFWFILLVVLIKFFYVKGFGLSLKKISLKNAEVETVGNDKESIFNEHLDEIIYFFQSTNYDFVVIEDLDRFENPNIFISLRELNNLINENAGVKSRRGGEPIKFIYALRDDMFSDKDRTKFFDFIIPVIPFINNSNSYDKLRESLEKVGLYDGLDAKFLRNIALHINDFRHLNNTINEFRIYLSNLDKTSLNKTKLFAIILYKNFYPNDFELLHNNKGILHSIVAGKSQKIKQASNDLKSTIDEISNEIKIAKESLVNDVQSLVYMYRGYLISEIGCRPDTLQTNGGDNLNSIEDFVALKSSASFRGVHANRGSWVNSDFDLSKLEAKFHSNQSIQEKVDEIKRCNKANIQNLQEELSDAQTNLRVVNQKKLRDVFTHEALEKEYSKGEEKSYRLLFYLICNGYIDEHYSTYTTYFHEGSLTNQDHEFLLLYQSDKIIEATYEVNNPKEVCQRVDDVFFEKRQSWNVAIYDYLLGNKYQHQKDLDKTLSLIRRNFKEGEKFLIEYYATGKYVGGFIEFLCEQWIDFTQKSIRSNYAQEHIARVIGYVSDEKIIEQQNKDDALTDYLEQHSHMVFSQEVCMNKFTLLSVLDVKILNLSSSEKLDTLLDYAIDNDNYRINTENINFILARSGMATSDVERSNYTSIRNSKLGAFKGYIETNIARYVEHVFLSLENNNNEEGDSVLSLLSNNDLSLDLRKLIISDQDFVYSFDDIPKDLWKKVVEERKQVVSWENIAKYYDFEDDKELITELLNEEDVYNELSKVDPNGKPRDFILFVMKNDGIDDKAYQALLASQAWNIQNLYDGLSHSKWIYLVRRKFVKLTAENFVTSSVSDEVVAVLIEKNYDDYAVAKSDYSLNNNIITLLLDSDLPDEQKEDLCYDIEIDGYDEDSRLAGLAAQFFSRQDFDLEGVDDLIITNSIEQSPKEEYAIKILCKCIPKWEEVKVMNVLDALGGNYAKISDYGKMPKIDNNKHNQALANALLENGYISSAPIKGELLQINTKRKA